MKPTLHVIWDDDDEISMQLLLPTITSVTPSKLDPSMVIEVPLLTSVGDTVEAVGVLAVENVYDTFPSKVKTPDETSTLTVSAVPSLDDVMHLISLSNK